MKHTKIIYVAHPYGGFEDNKKEVERILVELQNEYPDYLFISPINCFDWAYDKYDYSFGMNMCLGLLDKCDLLLLCTGWQKSKGCNIEYRYAVNSEHIDIAEYPKAKGTL